MFTPGQTNVAPRLIHGDLRSAARLATTVETPRISSKRPGEHGALLSWRNQARLSRAGRIEGMRTAVTIPGSTGRRTGRTAHGRLMATMFKRKVHGGSPIPRLIAGVSLESVAWSQTGLFQATLMRSVDHARPVRGCSATPHEETVAVCSTGTSMSGISQSRADCSTPRPSWRRHLAPGIHQDRDHRFVELLRVRDRSRRPPEVANGCIGMHQPSVTARLITRRPIGCKATILDSRANQPAPLGRIARAIVAGSHSTCVVVFRRRVIVINKS